MNLSLYNNNNNSNNGERERLTGWCLMEEEVQPMMSSSKPDADLPPIL